MRELNVIVDVSTSMYTLGKPAIIATLLSTLDSLPNEIFGEFEIKKHGWDGTAEKLAELLQENSAALILTDGYALSDNGAKLDARQNLFVVLCGADAIPVSALKNLGRTRSVSADNILFAVETLVAICPDNENDAEDWV